MGHEEQQDLSHLTPERIAVVFKFGEELRQKFIDNASFERASIMRDLLMLARRRPEAASVGEVGDIENIIMYFIQRWCPSTDETFIKEMKGMVEDAMKRSVAADRRRILVGIERVMGEIRGQL